MSEPLVSYIVPFWNACSGGRKARWWMECIESLLDQTHSRCEFIFVNDGSTDYSGAVVAGVAQHEDRVRVCGTQGAEAHQGIESALNAGLALAQGQFIARLDSDDIALPERTKTQLAYFQSHPEIHVLGAGMKLVDENGGTMTHISADGVLKPYVTRWRSLRVVARERCPFFHPTVMFSRCVYEQIGGYPIGYNAGEDYAYWVRVLRWFRGANIEDAVTCHRQHPHRTSVSRCREQTETTARIMQEAGDLPELSPFDQLWDAYMRVNCYNEQQMHERVNAGAVARNAELFGSWRREHTEAPLEEFYDKNPSYFDELLYWNTVRMWDGQWRIIVENATGDVLDFGGGLGLVALLCPKAQYTHYDPSAFCRELVGQHTPSAKILARPEDIAPSSYDSIVCLDVLEHLAEAALVPTVERLAAALRSRGKLILTHNFGKTEVHPMHTGTPEDGKKVAALLLERHIRPTGKASVYQKDAI
jgi:2-polyprenyl-3-methyl-5-hydroxy-6-metoxy-1,4-benzoquinol methylase